MVWDDMHYGTCIGIQVLCSPLRCTVDGVQRPLSLAVVRSNVHMYIESEAMERDPGE